MDKYETGRDTDSQQKEGEEHYESFYHCLDCRQVFYFENTDEKVTERCPNCGPGTQFKITEADDAF